MNNIKDTTAALYTEQFKWALWFTGIMTAIRVVLHIVDHYVDTEELPVDSFVEFAYQPGKIFLLVLGIMSAYYFLGTLIEHGKTRKTFFKSALISAGLLAVTLPAFAFILNVVENLIIAPPVGTAVINNTALQTYSITAFLTFCFTIFLYYALGMLIGIGYYRFGWLFGFAFVAAGLLTLLIESMIWGTEFFLFGLAVSNPGTTPLLALPLTAVLAAFISYAAFRFIKRTPVKLE
jgi:hypothetical protein